MQTHATRLVATRCKSRAGVSPHHSYAIDSELLGLAPWGEHGLTISYDRARLRVHRVGTRLARNLDIARFLGASCRSRPANNHHKLARAWRAILIQLACWSELLSRPTS